MREVVVQFGEDHKIRNATALWDSHGFAFSTLLPSCWHIVVSGQYKL
jgi:hypothetical protein